MTSRRRLSLLLPLLLAPALGGCTGAILGNLFVVGLTVGIFFGTLGLGRSSTNGSRADQSTNDR
jgi:hypothetical protein